MEAFIGTVLCFAGNFAPRGWAFCNGQLLSIAQNTALFSILGTTYGGDGQTTFALPDFRSRVPLGAGNGPGLSDCVLGEMAGVESVTLMVSQMPMHNHLVNASCQPATETEPGNNYPGTGQNGAYSTSADTNMNPMMMSATGGSQPHENRQPYLGMNFIICLEGIFPSRW